MTDTMHDSLFDDSQVPVLRSVQPAAPSSASVAEPAALPAGRPRAAMPAARVEPAAHGEALQALRDALSPHVRLGTSDGRGQQANPMYLDPTIAAEQFVRSALEGLGHKVGALVFQLSPLPGPMLAQLPDILQRIRTMLAALPAMRPVAPDAVMAVEVRNPEFLTPDFVGILREAGATYCLGLHARMPTIDDQLPLQRALWPGPLVCRWNLNRRHGAYGYEDAKGLYEPFDKLVDPDSETHAALARVIVGTTGAGHNAYVTINNKAEGSAPLSVVALAEAIVLLSKSAA